jgi:hypothetical protein
LASPKTLGHSPKIEVCGDDDGGSLVQPADEMEQKLAPGLGERQIAEFVKDNEVHAREVIGNAPLASGTGLAQKPMILNAPTLPRGPSMSRLSRTKF